MWPIFLAQGLADAAPRQLTRRTALYACAAAVGYFVLQTGAEWLTAGVLPATPAPGRLEWTLMALAVLSFGLVALAQALLPLWASHPAAEGRYGVLEMILTAPVVVASWISLQYFGSTGAPDVFGAGNKLLHNVTGGIDVVEGNGGLLRAALPWQSVHDGERLMHEPLRLCVVIEAPREAIAGILQHHANVRSLFDNRWLHLFAFDGESRMSWRYSGNGRWEEASQPHSVAA